MAIVRCNKCGEEYSSSNEICPACDGKGNSVSSTQSQVEAAVSDGENPMLPWAIAGVSNVALIGWAAWVFLFMDRAGTAEPIIVKEIVKVPITSTNSPQAILEYSSTNSPQVILEYLSKLPMGERGGRDTDEHRILVRKVIHHFEELISMGSKGNPPQQA